MNQHKINLFLQKIEKTDDCWIWTAAKTPAGYGHFRTENYVAKKYAHRISYKLFVGKIPEGFCVLHKCDNPTCVKPDHLFLGTYKDNADDKSAKGRHHNQKKESCPKGHPYNRVQIRNGKTRRLCRICMTEGARKWRAKCRRKK